MRCSCRVCGTYMVQTERGLASGCQCPDCGARCCDCMGSAQGPLSPAALAARFETGGIPEVEAAYALPEEPPARDWHREL